MSHGLMMGFALLTGGSGIVGFEIVRQFKQVFDVAGVLPDELKSLADLA